MATTLGQPPFTHALLEGSPALDAADSAACTTASINSLDQRGITRPQDGGCDIGAALLLTLNNGNNQSTRINTAFTQPLQVTLVAPDKNMNVSGRMVTFTAPSGGASLNQTIHTATTDSNGVASVMAPTTQVGPDLPNRATLTPIGG